MRYLWHRLRFHHVWTSPAHPDDVFPSKFKCSCGVKWGRR